MMVIIALHALALVAAWQLAPTPAPALRPRASIPVSLLVPARAKPAMPPQVKPALPKPATAKPEPPSRSAPKAPASVMATPLRATTMTRFDPLVAMARMATPITLPPAPSPATIAKPMPTTTASAGTPTPAAPSLRPPRFDAAYLDNPPPEYPAFSRRRGEQGRVLLRVQVGVDGNPRQVQVSTSSGSTRLDTAAVDTVRRWRFVPAKLGDESVEAWVLVPIVFTLTS
jgi:protein TonB